VLGHAIAELHQSVLDMAGVLFIAEIFTDLLLRERAAKPSAPPEQESALDGRPAGTGFPFCAKGKISRLRSSQTALR